MWQRGKGYGMTYPFLVSWGYFISNIFFTNEDCPVVNR